MDAKEMKEQKYLNVTSTVTTQTCSQISVFGKSSYVVYSNKCLLLWPFFDAALVLFHLDRDVSRKTPNKLILGFFFESESAFFPSLSGSTLKNESIMFFQIAVVARLQKYCFHCLLLSSASVKVKQTWLKIFHKVLSLFCLNGCPVCPVSTSF